MRKVAWSHKGEVRQCATHFRPPGRLEGNEAIEKGNCTIIKSEISQQRAVLYFYLLPGKTLFVG